MCMFPDQHVEELAKEWLARVAADASFTAMCTSCVEALKSDVESVVGAPEFRQWEQRIVGPSGAAKQPNMWAPSNIRQEIDRMLETAAEVAPEDSTDRFEPQLLAFARVVEMHSVRTGCSVHGFCGQVW